MEMRWKVITTLLGLAVIAAVAAGPIMSNVEHPDYQVIQASGDIEVRQYEPVIIAEVEVTGDRKDSINNGFRLLADYIFGNNTIDQDISMTAPVTQQAQEQNTKIAMTAPVQQKANGNRWKISFIMPSEHSLESLPTPNNDVVKIKHVAAKKMVAIKFSGTSSDNNILKHEKQLLEFVDSNSLNVSGTPQYAFYNPPFTLPFLRRNEVMLEIR